MKKMIAVCLLTMISISAVTGCNLKGKNGCRSLKKDFMYDVSPEKFTLTAEHDGVKLQA